MSREWTVWRICLLMFGSKGLILLWINLLYFDIISFTFCFFCLFITFRIWSSRCGSVLSSPGCVCCTESIGRDVSWETRLDKGNPPLDEGLRLKTSAWNSIRWPSYITNSVDKSKLSCYTPPPTQHHRFTPFMDKSKFGFVQNGLIYAQHTLKRVSLCVIMCYNGVVCSSLWLCSATITC